MNDELAEELFPIRRTGPDAPPRRPRRSSRPSKSSPDSRASRPKPPSRSGPDSLPNQPVRSIHQPLDGSTWRRAVAVGLGSGVVALAARLALLASLPAADVHRLPGNWLWLGVLGVACVFCLCSRLGVRAVVCLAGALAIAVADVAAPFGIGFLLVAVFASKGADSRPGAQHRRETDHDDQGAGAP